MSVTIPMPVPGLVTADEYIARHYPMPVELVRGVVRELPPMPGFDHGEICLTIGWLLKSWAIAGDHGRVASNDAFVRTGSNPDTIRGADVLFFTYERLPRGQRAQGITSLPPDLVVEVRSPSDVWIELFAKVEEYLAVGVRAVLILDLASETASVYLPGSVQRVYESLETLQIPDVLPGFAVPVRDLFA